MFLAFSAVISELAWTSTWLRLTDLPKMLITGRKETKIKAAYKLWLTHCTCQIIQLSRKSLHKECMWRHNPKKASHSSCYFFSHFITISFQSSSLTMLVKTASCQLLATDPQLALCHNWKMSWKKNLLIERSLLEDNCDKF